MIRLSIVKKSRDSINKVINKILDKIFNRNNIDKLDTFDIFLRLTLKQFLEISYFLTFFFCILKFLSFFAPDGKLTSGNFQHLFIMLFSIMILLCQVMLLSCFSNFKISTLKSSTKRLITLIYIVSFELFCITAQWQNIVYLFDQFEWLKPVAFSIVASIPAAYLWYWRDRHKVKDHKQKEEELNLQKTTNV